MKRLIVFITILLIAAAAIAGPQTTSSTTGTNMIARARVYLDEPAASLRKWSEAELLQFLNDGMIDMSARTHCYQTTESIDLVANTIEYTPTAEYTAIISIVCNPASGKSWGLKKGNIRSQGEQISDDAPQFWYEFANKIGVYPAYTSVTTETVTVYVAKKPDAIAAGETVVTPQIFDKALVYYIVAQALLKDKRPIEAANYLTLYQQELDRYRGDFVEVDNETPDPVR